MQMATVVLTVLWIVVVRSEDGDLCIKCRCNKRSLIQSLYTANCSHLGLSHTFPNLSQWPDYAQVSDTRIAANFDWNNIRNLQKFPRLLGIVSLSFRHNEMSTLEGSAFVELENLKALDLSYNHLTADGIQADVFRGCYSPERYEPLGIVILNLGHNDIHSLSPHAFEHLPNLMELRLNNNPLSVLDDTALLALESPLSLQILDLAYTGLSSISQAFVDLTSLHHKLQELYLNGNQFSQVPETLAALGDSLQKLNLNDNPISELQEDSFRGLVMLREINISAMQHLSRIGPSTFSHLKNLEVLHCSYNQHLVDVDAEAFQYGDNKTPLRELHLRSNALHTLPENLLPWEHLSVIDVQDNPWRCDCSILWLVDKLVPLLVNYTPDLVTQLHCSEPLRLSGTSILSFKNPDNLSKLCNEEHKSSTTKSYYNALNAALLAVGIILLISTAVGLTTLYLLRRWTNRTLNFKLFVSPNIRYVRTRFDS